MHICMVYPQGPPGSSCRADACTQLLLGADTIAHRAAGLTPLQFHAESEGMMVVVREQFAAGGAEGTETCVFSVELSNDENERRKKLRLILGRVLCRDTAPIDWSSLLELLGGSDVPKLFLHGCIPSTLNSISLPTAHVNDMSIQHR